MNVREFIESEVRSRRERIKELTEILDHLDDAVGELESDSVRLFGNWLTLRDESHKDLGSKLAAITGQSYRFKLYGTLRTAFFRDVGPFYSIALDRPNPKCRKVRALRLPKEVELKICGDLPEGYELLEELDVPA